MALVKAPSPAGENREYLKAKNKQEEPRSSNMINFIDLSYSLLKQPVSPVFEVLVKLLKYFSSCKGGKVERGKS